MKNLVFTTVLSFFALGLNGQSLRSEGEFYGGISAGASSSKVTSMKFVKTAANGNEKEEAAYGRLGFGFQVGGFAGYHFSDDFAIQAEALYSLRNFKSPKLVGVDDKNYAELAFRNHYIDVPILIKYYPAESFYIAVGPQIGFAMSMQSKKAEFSNGKAVETKSEYKNINENNAKIGNKFNFAGLLGIGYDITENFNVDLRYIHGFAPSVYDSEKFNPDPILRNSGTIKIGKGNNYSMWQLGVGYTF